MPTFGQGFWAVRGEAIVALARRPRRYESRLPRGMHRVPGPVILLAERFVDSPIGPYLSMAIGEPVRLGLRVGYYFGVSALDSAEARRRGREEWGFPHELGSLLWLVEGTNRTMVWEERGIELRAEVGHRAWPLLLAVRSLQQRTDGPVIVPTNLRSLARRSHVQVSVERDDRLAGLAGGHPGMVLSAMNLRRRPARRPLGLASTLRAPLRPEPGVVRLVSGGQCGRLL